MPSLSTLSFLRALPLLLAVLSGCSLVRDSDDFFVDEDGSTPSDGGLDGSLDGSPDGANPDASSGCRSNGECEAFPNSAALCNVASGECELGACANLYADCDDQEANGCEVQVDTNGNCGGCGVTCMGDLPFCDVTGTGAMCTDTCRADSTECGMDCVDIETNVSHCGGCDMACPVPAGALMATCAAEECGFECNEGRADCDANAANGCETATASDLMNCGGCGTVCDLPNVAAHTCVDSGCGVGECAPGFADCDGSAANGCELELNDPENCGCSAAVCGAGISCLNGRCDPYVDVAVSFDHSCALRESGAVDCWGSNESAQYDGTLFPTPSETPFRVRWTPPGAMAEETDFLARDVSVGSASTCFVSADPASDGVLYCMGSNGSIRGGRAAGSPDAPPQPVELGGVGPLPAFVSVESRNFHSCAIDVDGEVWCWGFNGDGQTSDLTTRFAVRVPGLPADAVEVQTSRFATCARLTNGTVHCFGANSVGQLGRGTVAAGAFPAPAPVIAVSGAGELSEVTRLFGGSEDFCAIRGAANDLVCWGQNLQRAIARDGAIKSRPVRVATGVRDVAMFHLGMCYVEDATGETHCRGREEESQFGGPPTDARADGAHYPVLDGIVEMEGGFHGGCGFWGGELLCWGWSAYGTVPRDSLIEEPTPIVDADGVAVSDLDKLVHSDEGSCGIRAGRAYCWGAAGRSESGDGTNTGSSTPKLVPELLNVVDIARGDTGVCAIRDAGAVNELWCWSVDASGVIGGIGNVSRPTRVPAVVDPVSIDMGQLHGCAVLRTGEVSCWGLNSRRQTGTTGATAPPTIVRLGGVPIAASAVATGFNFSCAILTGADAGDVVCWGSNEFGQLATGSTGADSAPVVTLATGAVSIEAGYLNACILNTADQVFCWGDGSYGQLGQGTTMTSGTPRLYPAAPGTTPVSVAAGARSICVAYADETVRCSGNNNFGQLGRPGPNSLVPVVVPGVVGTVVVNSSNWSFANCAGNGGRWSCWGLNDFGKLGTDRNIYLPPTLIGR